MVESTNLIIRQLSIVNAFSEFVNMEKIDHRYAKQYFHLKGLSPTNIKAELDSTLGESGASFKLYHPILYCCRTSCPNEHRSARPNEAQYVY